MGLAIVLETAEVAPGGVVRGRVTGLDDWPEAREARVALRHRTKHLKAGAGAETALAAGPAEAAFSLPLPDDAYPTFEGKHYRSEWVVEVAVDLARRRDPTAEAAFVVRPPVRPQPPAAPTTEAWGGYARFRRFLAIFVALDLALLGGVWAVIGSVPAPVLLALLVPAVLSGLALGLLSRAGSAVDRLELLLPRKAWRFGESVAVEVALEADPDDVPSLAVALTGEEVWVTSTGQTTTTHRETVHKESRTLDGPGLLGVREGARRWVWRIDLPLPESGPPSRKKDLEWRVRAWVPLPRRPNPSVAVELEVGGRAG